MLESETYIGGKVEGCECGVFCADLPLKFRCKPGHYQVRAQSDLPSLYSVLCICGLVIAPCVRGQIGSN